MPAAESRWAYRAAPGEPFADAFFDRFLVRPIDPLFHLLADRFCHDGIGNFIVGAILVAKSSATLGIPWTPLNLAYLVLAVLSGGVIFIALNLLTCVSAFWIMDSVPVTRVVFDNHLFAQYPLTIYPRAIGIWLTWLIPYGFASFYPASYLLGRDVGALAFLAATLRLRHLVGLLHGLELRHRRLHGLLSIVGRLLAGLLAGLAGLAALIALVLLRCPLLSAGLLIAGLLLLAGLLPALLLLLVLGGRLLHGLRGLLHGL